MHGLKLDRTLKIKMNNFTQVSWIILKICIQLWLVALELKLTDLLTPNKKCILFFSFISLEPYSIDHRHPYILLLTQFLNTLVAVASHWAIRLFQCCLISSGTWPGFGKSCGIPLVVQKEWVVISDIVNKFCDQVHSMILIIIKLRLWQAALPQVIDQRKQYN